MTNQDEPPIRVPKRDSQPSWMLRAAQLLIFVLALTAVVAKLLW